MKTSINSSSPKSKATRSVLLLIVFSVLLWLVYTVLAFFATWGDWTDSYYHQGHPERLAQDMVGNSFGVGMYSGMYIVIQQILLFIFLKDILTKRIRIFVMFVALIVSFIFVNMYTTHILRNVEDNIMHLPQVIQYPGHERR